LLALHESSDVLIRPAESKQLASEDIKGELRMTDDDDDDDENGSNDVSKS